MRRVGLTTDGPEVGTRMAAGAPVVVFKINYSKASVLSQAAQLAIAQYSDDHGVKAAADHF